MGKVRIKTLGIEELEQAQKEKAKKRKEAKKTARAPGLKGGERLVSMGPSEEEIAQAIEKPATTETQKDAEAQKEKLSVSDKFSASVVAREPSKRARPPRQRSKRYQEALKEIDRTRRYRLPEAVSLLKKTGFAQFDGTVELHINTIEKGISGQVTLPHGTGKKLRVAIADPSAGSGSFESLLKRIEQGNIDFDVLIAHPSAMPHLAKVAKILGPRGLMPNPKAGTISEKPAEVAKKYESGQVTFRTESQAPIIHTVVGKISFKEKALEENTAALLNAVGANKVRSATLKSTMSPGIKLDVSSLA